MNKFNIFLILMFCVNTAFSGLALQKVSNDDFPDIDWSESVLFNDQLYFIANGFLARSDGTNKGTQILNIASNKLNTPSGNLTLHDNKLFYTNDNRLWMSDGQNAQMVSDNFVSSFRALKSMNGILFMEASAGSGFILQTYTDGEVQVFDDLTLPFIPTICAIDDSFLVRTIDPDDSEDYAKLVHYRNGEKSILFDEKNSGSLPTFITESNGLCFYKSFTELLAINSLGSIEVIDIPEQIRIGQVRLVKFGEHLYLTSNRSFSSRKLYRFDFEGKQWVEAYDFTPDMSFLWQFSPDIKTSSSNNYLYVELDASSIISDARVLLIYDQDLNLVSSTDFRDIGSGVLPNAVSINDTEYIITDRKDEVLLGYQGYTQNDSYLETRGVKIRRLFAADDKLLVLAQKKDVSDQTGIYTITDKPQVSNNLKGIWVSDQWQDQGLVISTGKRADASEYMFVSFYLYRDGQPFWVAGSHNMVLGDGSITIELSEFTGASFIDGEQANSTQSVFGQIIIEPSGCNEISAVIQPVVGEVVDLIMRRIGNENISNCVD